MDHLRKRDCGGRDEAGEVDLRKDSIVQFVISIKLALDTLKYSENMLLFTFLNGAHLKFNTFE